VVRTSCRSCLRWLLDMSTAAPPKMRKTFSTARKPPAPPSPLSFLASSFFRSDVTVVFSEHVALLEGVVDGGLVLRA
jgi:hypothetical protein